MLYFPFLICNNDNSGLKASNCDKFKYVNPKYRYNMIEYKGKMTPKSRGNNGVDGVLPCTSLSLYLSIELIGLLDTWNLD